MIDQKTNRHHWISCFVIFLFCLFYMVIGTGWYDQGVMKIRGSADVIPSSFEIKWDSGNGLNKYERKRITLGTKPKKGESVNQVRIRFLDRMNNASESTKIVCKEIIADGQVLPLNNLLKKTKAGFRNGLVVLDKNFPELALDIEARQAISIELLSNTNSGIVEIEVNDELFQRDLYVANVEAKNLRYEFWVIDEENIFTATMDLPRYPVKRFYLIKSADSGSINIDSVIALSGKREKSLLQEHRKDFNVIELPSTNQIQKRYLSAGIFCQQVLYALLLTWIYSGLFRLYRAVSGFRGLFSAGRYTFWLFLAGAGISFSFWLLAFWPGVMSVDSLKIWRAAQLPEVYLNDHPVLNVFLYSFLFQLWNSPAVVAVFQVVMTSLLVAWIFYRIFQSGVSLKLLLPFYLATVLSVSAGLYNVVLWKDIPFALLVVFWGFYTVELYEQKRAGERSWTFEKTAALLLLLAALCLLRHNGLIYIVFMPLLYVLWGILKPGKRTLMVSAAIVLLGGIVILGAVSIGGWAHSGYLFQQGQVYLKNLSASGVDALWDRFWNNYWGVLDINQDASKWDLFHFYLNDRYSYKFLHHSGWSDVYSYLPKPSGIIKNLREFAMTLYWASYKSPWVYLAWNQVWALFLYIFCMIGFKWLPRSALFSSVILVQVVTLSVLLNVMNWRYYYFASLASCFIIPLILLDIYKMRSEKA